jgi:hypothetical protein
VRQALKRVRRGASGKSRRQGNATEKKKYAVIRLPGALQARSNEPVPASDS